MLEHYGIRLILRANLCLMDETGATDVPYLFWLPAGDWSMTRSNPMALVMTPQHLGCASESATNETRRHFRRFCRRGDGAPARSLAAGAAAVAANGIKAIICRMWSMPRRGWGAMRLCWRPSRLPRADAGRNPVVPRCSTVATRGYVRILAAGWSVCG